MKAKAGVSDHPACAWFDSGTSPSGVHMLVVAAHCDLLMTAVLELTGLADVALTIDLEAARRLPADGH